MAKVELVSRINTFAFLAPALRFPRLRFARRRLRRNLFWLVQSLCSGNQFIKHLLPLLRIHHDPLTEIVMQLTRRESLHIRCRWFSACAKLASLLRTKLLHSSAISVHRGFVKRVNVEYGSSGSASPPKMSISHLSILALQRSHSSSDWITMCWSKSARQRSQRNSCGVISANTA